MRKRLPILVLLLGFSVFALTQTKPPPAPRLANGRINLGTSGGEKGVWIPPNAGDERLVELDSSMEAKADPFAIDTNPLQRTPRAAGVTTSTSGFPGKLTVSQVPFQPWSRALYAFRAENQLEPHIRCKPSGGTRQFLTPYGVEFVDLPQISRMYIVDIGGPHSIRIIYMNAGGHPKDLAPSDYGHSIGRWEGDTLIVDTTGYNEKFWIDRQGTPHTDRLHLVERFTRTDFSTLRYEFTVDDPGAYTAQWTSGILLRWSAGQELFEYVCQDNNLAPELAVGQAGSIDRHSAIAP